MSSQKSRVEGDTRGTTFSFSWTTSHFTPFIRRDKVNIIILNILTPSSLTVSKDQEKSVESTTFNYFYFSQLIFLDYPFLDMLAKMSLTLG